MVAAVTAIARRKDTTLAYEDALIYIVHSDSTRDEKCQCLSLLSELIMNRKSLGMLLCHLSELDGATCSPVHMDNMLLLAMKMLSFA